MESFQFQFHSSKSPNEIFKILIDPKKWWFGLYGEKLEGSSEMLDDIFTFEAGDGVHFSKQQLIKLLPNEKIVWKVIESNLTFLQQKDEWNQTEIGFDIKSTSEGSIVTFSHNGLIAEMECYNGCSNAWTLYLQNLKNSLN